MMKQALRAVSTIGLAVLACVGLISLIDLLNPTRLKPKSDFAQDYFLARATVAGINPYLPLSELGTRFGVPDQIPHPSTHPPSFAVLCLPLAFLSFEHAAFLWLIIGLVSLVASLYLLFNVKKVGLPIVFLAVLVWPPIWFDLTLGQLMLPQLLLLTVAWRALRTDQDLIGGGLLGLTIAIKLIVWPLLLLLVFKKRLRALLSAAAALAFTNVTALLLIGLHPITYYYFKVGPEVSSIYNNNVFNISAWSIGTRLFEGTRSVDIAWFHTRPLVNAPALSSLTSIAAALAILAYTFLVALRARNFDTSFVVVICASVLLSPVAWIFYLTLLLPSFATLRRANDWRSRLTLVLCLLAPFCMQRVLPTFGASTSFAVALLMMVPLFTVLLLIKAHHDQDRLSSLM